MRKLFATLTIFFLFVAPVIVEAANCPAEVQTAKDMLKKQSAKADESQAPRALAGARSEANAPRSQESNAPRSQDSNAPRVGGESSAPRSQDSNAPRASREANAPRSQESNAPRTLGGAMSREANAPRSQESNAPRATRESNAPRGQDSAAPRTAASAPQVSKARILVKDAEAACKAGDMTKATEKAKAAMELLK